MQIAEVLSDLTSLRVCDPAAALALVSATTTSPANETKTGGEAAPENNKDAAEKEDAEDADLRRARDLLALRAVFKNEGGSLAAELARWREEVRRRMMAVADGGGFAGVTAGTESDGEEEARQGGEGEGEEDEGFEDWA